MQLYLLYLQIIPTFVPIKSNPIINKTSTAVMKKKTILFASCLFGVFAFSSCEKNLYDESKQPEKEIQVKDLNIPAGFQWKLTQVAAGTVAATTPTMVSFFLDEACSKEEKIADIPVDTEISSLPLSIPTYVNTLYAQYKTSTNEIKKVAIPVNADRSFSLNIANDAKSKSNTTRSITRGHDIEDDIQLSKGVISHPKDGWGTIMFEDQFPSLGDYDFNDFVAWYKYQLQDFFHKGGTWYTYVMQIGFQIRALGGINDFSPYINLAGVKYDDIDEIIFQETGDGIEFIKGPNGEAILSYTNPSKPAGSKYLNTEPEYITTSGVNTSIYIYFKEPVELSRLQDKMVDIYLAKPDHGTEIHLKGYKGIYPSSQNAKYSNEDNYVWGLKAPAALNHMIEENDFIKGYPKFKDWIEGKGHKQWWVSPKNDYLILLN